MRTACGIWVPLGQQFGGTSKSCFVASVYITLTDLSAFYSRMHKKICTIIDSNNSTRNGPNRVDSTSEVCQARQQISYIELHLESTSSVSVFNLFSRSHSGPLSRFELTSSHRLAASRVECAGPPVPSAHPCCILRGLRSCEDPPFYF